MTDQQPDALFPRFSFFDRIPQHLAVSFKKLLENSLQYPDFTLVIVGDHRDIDIRLFGDLSDADRGKSPLSKQGNRRLQNPLFRFSIPFC